MPAVFVIVVVALAYFTFNGVKNLVAGAPLGAGLAANINDPGSEAQGQADVGQAAASGDEPVEEGWSEGRVTVLLLGIDERESENGPWRTDTMILLTIDPTTNRAGMLSIPRDMWVEIPDYGSYDRINTAYFRGDADNYPGGGGPALAMKTVQQNLGVTVNYYAAVNFQAFISIVDLLDCVPINVPETIDDPDYPAMTGSGYDPFYVEAGDHCMDGETLLKYARTRATFGGDFDRARRQQAVLYAVRDHVLSTGQLSSLIAQSPEIYATLQDNIRTNLTEGQIVELVRLAAGISDDKICSAVIAGDYIERLETLSDGSQVVIPDRAEIRQLIMDIYTGTGQCDPAAQDLQADAAAEAAVVEVLNGTRQEGLASVTGERLTAAGIDVLDVGNADRFDYAETQIIDYTGKTGTAHFIAETLGVPETAIVAGTNPDNVHDIQVILGQDALGTDE